MNKILFTAAALVTSLSTAALAQAVSPSAEVQSGSNIDAKAVKPSVSAATSAATATGGTEDSQIAVMAAATAADHDSPAGPPTGNTSPSRSGNVTPNGTMTANPPGAGASSEATLNEHGATGTATGTAR